MHQFLENVRVAARTACPPWRGNPSLEARPPNHVGDPQRAHRPRFCEVLAGYHPNTRRCDALQCPPRACRACRAWLGEAWQHVEHLPASGRARAPSA
eukprot:scaffold66288_cov69-Phaeocystis_antarctica.AAC.1